MTTWKPKISIELLAKRAEILAKIREFFYKKQVVEVETPALSHAAVTDPHLHTIAATLSHLRQTMYLQTSPEFAMKRLLAAGSGSIYQICKAFRDGESGHLHNPEFTILEWYRVGFNHHDLMNEMDELLQFILTVSPAERFFYQEIFEKVLKINPHTETVKNLKQLVMNHQLNVVENINYDDRDLLLQLLMSDCIEPTFSKTTPTFIYDYPKSQAMLSRIRHDNPPVGERFEVYFGAIELANGFHELTDVTEQRQRFEADQVKRAELGYEPAKMDERFLEALEHGLPDCAGVALGLDRLMMLALHQKNISDVMTFPFDRA